MKFRVATVDDIEAMSRLLQELVTAGRRTAPCDVDFVRTNYVCNPHGIRCTVAEDQDSAVLGFQSLIHAVNGNRFGVEAGWGIIGTHVSPRAFRRGIGKGLWKASVHAARSAGVKVIDARVDTDNAEGLAYYGAIGFRSYRTPEGIFSMYYSDEPSLAQQPL